MDAAAYQAFISEKEAWLMRYLPKSPAERREMLASIGAQSIDDLFASIPGQFRLKTRCAFLARFLSMKSSSIFERGR